MLADGAGCFIDDALRHAPVGAVHDTCRSGVHGARRNERCAKDAREVREPLGRVERGHPSLAAVRLRGGGPGGRKRFDSKTNRRIEAARQRAGIAAAETGRQLAVGFTKRSAPEEGRERSAVHRRRVRCRVRCRVSRRVRRVRHDAPLSGTRLLRSRQRERAR